jgi:glycosyltransferase involved in cell wall biosynthesis
VLSTYHAGIPEAVVHGVNGLLCQEGDVETYARQMSEIYTWGYKEENRKAVETQFSFESHVQKLENFYKFIIAEKKKQQA